MAKRKGPIRPCDVPTGIRTRLNNGTLETSNLAEALAVDFRKLFLQAAPKAAAFADRLGPEVAFTKRMRIAGEILLSVYGKCAYEHFRTHPSDTVRGWAAYALGAERECTINSAIDRVKPLADDPHFGVREWAWMAIRPLVARDVRCAIRSVKPLTREPSERLRRFASELTRPRGVWCEHLVELRDSPKLGLPILNPLKADVSRYVQNSVANWLNDAAKSNSEWVVATCQAWLASSPTKETQYICRRACRSVE